MKSLTWWLSLKAKPDIAKYPILFCLFGKKGLNHLENLIEDTACTDYALEMSRNDGRVNKSEVARMLGLKRTTLMMYLDSRKLIERIKKDKD